MPDQPAQNFVQEARAALERADERHARGENTHRELREAVAILADAVEVLLKRD